jgi:hypothetical protein
MQILERNKETKWLYWYAGFTTLWLLLWIFVALVLLTVLMPSSSDKAQRDLILCLCILAGTVSSGISALLSVTSRIANGWEFSTGDKYPHEIPKDKFGVRMIPAFLVRPFLGTAMGFFVYVGIGSGFLIATNNSGENNFSVEGLVFLSLLGGLFAKTLLERMKDIFKAIFGGSDKAQT